MGHLYYILILILAGAQRLSSARAGIVMFCGQGADGLATPLVGLLSDRSKGIPSLGLGRRKLFYVGGTLIVMGVFS